MEEKKKKKKKKPGKYGIWGKDLLLNYCLRTLSRYWRTNEGNIIITDKLILSEDLTEVWLWSNVKFRPAKNADDLNAVIPTSRIVYPLRK